MAEPTLLLTKSQVAEALGVSTSTFTSWVNSGLMPEALPGLNRWSRVQIERAASGLSWIPPESAEPAPVKDPYEAWLEKEDAREKSLHSYGNQDFNPTGPLGKREIKMLLALHGRNQPLGANDVHGASTATIEKLGMRGYLVENGYFYKLLLTKTGREAAERLFRQSK